MNSSGASNSYPWVLPSPGMHRYRGVREFAKLAQKSKTVENIEYSAELEIPLSVVQDDQAEMYIARARQIGNEAAQWPVRLVLDALQAYATTTDLFGDALSGNSHTTSGMTIDNLQAATVAGSDGVAHRMHTIIHDGFFPLYYQSRLNPEMQRNSDEDASEKKSLRFWVDLRGAAFGGLPSHIVTSTFAHTPTVAEIQTEINAVRAAFAAHTLEKTSMNDPTRYIWPQLDLSTANCTFACSARLAHIVREAVSASLIGSGNTNIMVGIGNVFGSSLLNA